MSFSRHEEIYHFDEGAILADHALAHRNDEFPAGYSLAGCTPAEPASASPAHAHLARKGFWSTMQFKRTVRSALTVCLTPGDKPSPYLADLAIRGLAISFSTRASVALSDSSIGFFTVPISTSNCKRKLFLLLSRITGCPSALSSSVFNLPHERIILMALESRRSERVGPAAIPERLVGPETR